jgi:hypothetical protein
MLLLCANFNINLPPPLDVTGMSQVGNRVINNKAVRNLMTFARQFRVTLNRYTADRGVIVTPMSETPHTHVVGSKTMWARTRELLWVRVEDGTDIAGSRNVALRCLHLSEAS